MLQFSPEDGHESDRNCHLRGTTVFRDINELFSYLEVILLRTGALILLAIYIYKQVRKHWREP